MFYVLVMKSVTYLLTLKITKTKTLTFVTHLYLRKPNTLNYTQVAWAGRPPARGPKWSEAATAITHARVQPGTAKWKVDRRRQCRTPQQNRHSQVLSIVYTAHVWHHLGCHAGHDAHDQEFLGGSSHPDLQRDKMSSKINGKRALKDGQKLQRTTQGVPTCGWSLRKSTGGPWSMHIRTEEHGPGGQKSEEPVRRTRMDKQHNGKNKHSLACALFNTAKHNHVTCVCLHTKRYIVVLLHNNTLTFYSKLTQYVTIFVGQVRNYNVFTTMNLSWTVVVMHVQ